MKKLILVLILLAVWATLVWYSPQAGKSFAGINKPEEGEYRLMYNPISKVYKIQEYCISLCRRPGWIDEREYTFKQNAVNDFNRLVEWRKERIKKEKAWEQIK